MKRPDWSWYATGPCHGIQLTDSRLVVACDHIELRDRNRQDPYYSHIIFSDDHGENWQIGGSADEGTNESCVFESVDGQLYLNCRNKYRLDDGGNYRIVTWSANGGESFMPSAHDAGLPEPICQGSVCRYSDYRSGGKNRVLFSNPASREGRHRLTVGLSYDECRNWSVSRTINEGASACSDLCTSNDRSILCLYERGDDRPYDRISLARFNLEWLTMGRDSH